jgi:hypothetical protein
VVRSTDDEWKQNIVAAGAADAVKVLNAERSADRRRVRTNGGHDLVPFTGQSAALVRDVLPAADLVARLVADADRALQRAAGLSC